MPQKYSFVDSHAGVKPKAGITTSNYPPKVKVAGAKKSKKSSKKMGY